MRRIILLFTLIVYVIQLNTIFYGLVPTSLLILSSLNVTSPDQSSQGLLLTFEHNRNETKTENKGLDEEEKKEEKKEEEKEEEKEEKEEKKGKKNKKDKKKKDKKKKDKKKKEKLFKKKKGKKEKELDNELIVLSNSTLKLLNDTQELLNTTTITFNHDNTTESDVRLLKSFETEKERKKRIKKEKEEEKKREREELKKKKKEEKEKKKREKEELKNKKKEERERKKKEKEELKNKKKEEKEQRKLLEKMKKDQQKNEKPAITHPRIPESIYITDLTNTTSDFAKNVTVSKGGKERTSTVPHISAETLDKSMMDEASKINSTLDHLAIYNVKLPSSEKSKLLKRDNTVKSDVEAVSEALKMIESLSVDELCPRDLILLIGSYLVDLQFKNDFLNSKIILIKKLLSKEPNEYDTHLINERLELQAALEDFKKAIHDRSILITDLTNSLIVCRKRIYIPKEFVCVPTKEYLINPKSCKAEDLVKYVESMIEYHVLRSLEASYYQTCTDKIMTCSDNCSIRGTSCLSCFVSSLCEKIHLIRKYEYGKRLITAANRAYECETYLYLNLASKEQQA